MASYENFYTGSAYPFEKPYGGFTGPNAYHTSVKDVSYPTDPLTANQLKKVSDKLSTGTRNIEVSGLGLMGGGPMKHLASIPRQHWKEIDRLRKLTGVDLTFHGPLVEATGAGGRENWTEDKRKEAETQMKASVELAQQMNSDSSEKNPKGMVMTFHSSNGLPEVKRRIKVGTNPDGSPKEEIVSFAVVNERTGEIGPLPKMKKEFLEKEGIVPSPENWLDEYNRQIWHSPLQNIAIGTSRAQDALKSTISLSGEIDKNFSEGSKGAFKLYELSTKDPQQYSQVIKEFEKTDPKISAWQEQFNSNISFARANIDNSYIEFKESFNRAMETATENDKNKLESYKKEALPVFLKYKNYKEGNGGELNLEDFNKQIIKGINILESLKKVPETYKSLEKFAIDKASETFSNVALHAFTNAKKQGVAPGIISIENPPAGMSGLTRADEIKDLIEASRRKFADKAVEQGIMSRKDAEEKSKQIIGATWDVGHINSIRKWGYGKKDVLREAKTIAPYVKHMHLADNLGFEDAELPIGMGNVPVDEILTAEWGENFRKAKKAIETGDWFSRQGGMGMTQTAVRESLSGLSAPVYSMGQAQHATYWNQAVNSYGSYAGGLGPINPEVHHSIYGGGFGGLPAYQGGEMPGKGSSSFSGTPME